MQRSPNINLSTSGSTNINIQSTEIGGLSFPSEITLKVEYVNDKKEGAGKVLSKKKVVLAEVNFQEDKYHGYCVFFDEKGRKIKECIFERGVQNGWGREYDKNSIVFEGIYKNGKRFSSLEEYREDPNFLEEKKDGKTISICKFNDNHKRDGMCYEYENGVINQIVLYENGKRKRVMNRFINRNQMIEYDEKETILYKGEYKGNMKNGYSRSGKGMVFGYKNGTINQIDHKENGVRKGYDVIEGKTMKQYEGERLVYEGEYCVDDDEYKRNGKGVYYYSSNQFFEGIFNKNEMVRKTRIVNNKVMIEYDDEGRVVYKGEYDDNKKKRKGEGLLFEYEGKKMIVYSCNQGVKMNKLKEIEKNRMIEFDENGLKVYEGEYKGDVENEFVRDGEGDVYDNNDELLFSGHWKNGKREGEGMCYRNGKLRFDGNWKDDKPNGDGRLLNENGNVIWEGDWKNGYGYIGNGMWLSYEDGKKCEFYENGNVKFKGEWKDGKPDGKGVWYDEKGNKKYEGVWKNGYMEIEKGVWFDYESGSTCLMNERGVIIYQGSIKNSKPNGYGKVVNENGLVFEGEWNEGILKIDEEIILEYENGLFYVNKLQNSNLFGCIKKILRTELTSSYQLTVKVKSNSQLECLSNQVCCLVISSGCCNDLKIDLMICNYEYLERIVLKKDSLQNLKSLVISNNPQLRSISDNNSNVIGSGALCNVNTVKISSIS